MIHTRFDFRKKKKNFIASKIDRITHLFTIDHRDIDEHKSKITENLFTFTNCSDTIASKNHMMFNPLIHHLLLCNGLFDQNLGHDNRSSSSSLKELII